MSGLLTAVPDPYLFFHALLSVAGDWEPVALLLGKLEDTGKKRLFCLLLVMPLTAIVMGPATMGSRSLQVNLSSGSISPGLTSINIRHPGLLFRGNSTDPTAVVAATTQQRVWAYRLQPQSKPAS